MKSFRQIRTLRDAGSATLEFAMFSVMVVTLLLAGADLVSFLRSRLRLEEVATSLARMTSGYQQLYAGDFASLFQAAQLMAGSIDVSGVGGATIITGLVNQSSGPVVAWRQQIGNVTFTSTYGAVGAAPSNLPDNYVVPAGSSVVAIEVQSAIHPWVLGTAVMGSIGNPVLRSAALYQPRGSLLSQITAGNRP